MAARTDHRSQSIAARIAGFAFVVVILSGLFNEMFIYSTIRVEGDIAATISNIIENEMLYRTAVVVDLTMFVGVIILALALYVVLKPVNPALALFGAFARLAEGVMGGVLVLLNLAVLTLATGADYLMGLEAEQVNALVGLFMDLQAVGYNVLLVFLGVGATVFLMLFFRSRYVPRLLALWGILTYLSMFFGPIAMILFPQHTEAIQMSFIPGALFEILFGLWLMLRAVDVRGSQRSPLTTA